MKAVILAAGMGTRLRPYTDTKPKCLVPLDGISLLDRQLKTFRDVGIADISVVGGYRAEMLWREGVRQFRNDAYETTNMVSTLFSAPELFLEPDDLIVSYGDIAYQQRVLEQLIASPGDVVVSADSDWLRYWKTRMDDPIKDVETFVLGPGNSILSLGNRPNTLIEIEGQFIGLIKIEASELALIYSLWTDLLEADAKSAHAMAMTDFLETIIQAGFDVKASMHNAGWAEVDSPSDLLVAEEHLLVSRTKH